ncbi:hypothetical protein [Nocardia sp. NPDC127526]|uniref:hypothetical protein n=1 Tax=Nocardia sp. NPDC127526 TaxID=3345393 RepID=UPI003636EB3C
MKSRRCRVMRRGEQTGTYPVQTAGSFGTTVAIGLGMGSSIVWGVLTTLGIGIAGVFSGIAVLIAVTVMRDRNTKRRL